MSGYDDYDGPTCEADLSVEQLHDLMATGLMCSQCGTMFREAHGYLVACAFCFRRMTEAEVAREGVRLATKDESNSAAWAARNRKRREKKNG